jgi:tricarballylate dehydrogenase
MKFMLIRQFDVVVVGGVAGLSAAVAAQEAGARVAVLERSTFDERGSNTRDTTAAIRMKSDDAASHDFLNVFGASSGYQVQPDFIEATVQNQANWSPLMRAASVTDPELIPFFVDEAPLAIAWLKAYGVKFGGIGFYGLTPLASPRIATTGGGLHLVEVMTAYAEKIGLEFFYVTTARGLVQNGRGDVWGLRAVSRAGGAREFACGAVMLACGFEGNAERVARDIGAKGRYLRPVTRGGYFNKGKGIAMALAIGAASAVDFAEYHTQPIDPRSPGT